jgi:putative Mg2+ transporter-C (MgtC) family protein
MHPDLASLTGPSLWIATAMALACGGAIGLERQLRGKPAGIRTSILICLGTAVFVRLGGLLQAEGGDATRVVGQVVVGVGFLGAGVIINTQGAVRGLTSAAVIWILAGIGSAIGLSLYAFSAFLALVTLFVLVGVGAIEKRIPLLRVGEHGHDHDEAARRARAEEEISGDPR